MKPYAQEQAESNQEAFETALEKHETVEDPTPHVYPTIPDDTDDDDFDIVIDDGAEPEEQEKTPSDPTADAITKLAEALTANQPKPEEPKAPERAPIPQADINKVRKEFNDRLHESEDPFSVAMDATQKVFGGQIAQQARVIQDLKKETMKADPDKAFILENYNTEVETVVASLPANQQNHPDVYEYAVNQVTLKHIGDLVNRRVEEATKPQAKTVRPGQTQTLGSTQGTPATKKRKKYKASRTDEAMAKKYGMKLKDYLIARGKI